ncbi:uncharacterized protein L969DRAFT_92533 [Mixia osmundae IAM 14324]|uniref:Deacetylase sirtuin-type domain-containing protein n=1 Tax=Mixia osmundae (strain CBS 9802 / IAM 14324 / JCM 22182 / KY 12970) TaxID=764103 RepID=G7DXU1_MIXOS|nr:uncharacterized protein L969DRAFT_92533 [Mixia osmundae IAM 14324]KEI41304.1 hypothetical protein L969DRAFT_92533 [Mixia osmundae IAM 14324]GAA95401.1 hypothetical protein E5Q_02055 [Mixia osmundae IAM 14324]
MSNPEAVQRGTCLLLPYGDQPQYVSANIPNWIRQPDDIPTELARVARAIIKAKRIAVVCGAGISTPCGIPDFRSAGGLFKTLKERNPTAGLTSGKDLFDASLFSSEANIALFNTMVGELRQMADKAEPSAFHHFLKLLDDQGKLFRVYTQNIDSIEEKVGLTYGLDPIASGCPHGPSSSANTRPPPSPSKRRRTEGADRASKKLPRSDAPSPESVDSEPPLTSTNGWMSSQVTQSSASSSRSFSRSSSSASSSTASSLASPLDFDTFELSSVSSLSDVDGLSPPEPSQSSAKGKQKAKRPEMPRVIPLHGCLRFLDCQKCFHREPLGRYLDQLKQGELIWCPACTERDELQALADGNALSLRPRGVGMLRASVVLYNEVHADGAKIGQITHRDLMGARPDLLIVAGTTLKVPGTKRLVKELEKVIRPAEASKPSALPQVICLNYEFPAPAKEWGEVFDCWLKADVQSIVDIVADEQAAQTKRLLERKNDKAKRAQEAERKRLEKAERRRVREWIAKEKDARTLLKDRLALAKARKGPLVTKVKAVDRPQAPLAPAEPAPKPSWVLAPVPHHSVFAADPIVEGKRERKPSILLSSPKKPPAQRQMSGYFKSAKSASKPTGKPTPTEMTVIAAPVTNAVTC